MTKAEFTIVGMIRKKRKKLIIHPDQRFEAGDILIIETVHKELTKIQNKGHLDLIHHNNITADMQSKDIELAEVIIPTSSRLVSRTFKQSRIKYRYLINLIAISRQGKPIQERIVDTKLKNGDVILLQGSPESIQEAIANLGLLPLLERGISVTHKHHTYLPLVAFLGSLLAIAHLGVPVEIAFCLAILGLIVSNTFPIRHIYRSIDWSVIMLLAAMIPVGHALESTGTTDIIANFLLIHAHQHANPLLFMGGIMLMTMIISGVINNVTTTVIMVPIAAAIANSLQVNLDPFLMAVCLGASCSFLTPIGHQNNVLVMSPGRYTFGDYFKLGFPLELIVLAIGVPMIAWIWPL